MSGAGKRLVRYRNKSYLRLPFGELQFGHLSGSIVLWWRGHHYIVRRGNA